MKRTIKLAVAAAMALGATSAFATNGDHLIGLGAKARGMGGIGIGMSHGAESALANPAMITSVKGTEISFGGTLFMPDVKTNLMGGGSKSSDADMSMIPEVSLATKVNDNFYWGIGMWGTAGMGVDYRNESAGVNMNMVTNLQLMQFGVPLAYKRDGLSVGITPIMQYGALDINYDDGGAWGINNTGAGVAQDFGYGYNLGAAYEMSGLSVGVAYKSAIEMEYKGQLSTATAPFAAGFGFNGGNALGDKLEQPAEIGAGVSYNMDQHTVAVDYKRIKWKSAKGYKEFGWDDQNVVIVGYEYTADAWAARLGFNHASNPIKQQDGTTVDGAIYNMFNLLGFPATVENHYSVGGTYNVSKDFTVDLAYVYAPEVKDTYDISAFGAGATIETKHSQDSVSFQLNYTF